MINVIIREVYSKMISPEILEKSIQAVAKQQNISPDFDVSVVIENDEEIQKLNAQYRGINEPTDVLSFSSDEVDPETGQQYFGDIIISLPRAKIQAQKAGHPLESEIQLLVIHGMLHLLGFDHHTEAEKQEMWDLQKKLLETLSIQINQLPEE